MIDFTTVVGVDREHVEELRWTWPTWVRNRPEILARPLLFVCDGGRPDAAWEADLSFVEHPDVRRVAWNQAGVSQREKMLTGLTLVPPRAVRTPWYLKLDTDTVAVEAGDWIPDAWFAEDEVGRPPVFVSSPWGYTKPPDAIERLDEWADGIAELARYPRLDIPVEPGASLVSYPRICSWCFFGRTDWTRRVTAPCGDRLPVPSQDTFLWYCAARRGDFFRRIRMKRVGWTNVSRRRALRRLCQSVCDANDDSGRSS